MKCREVDSYAELSFDGELDANDRAELEEHLHRCPACRRRSELSGWLHSQLRVRLREQGFTATLPLGLKTRITSRIRADRGSALRWSHAAPLVLGMMAFGILAAANQGNTTPLDPDASVERHAAQLPLEVRAFGDVRSVRRFLRQNFRHPVDFPRIERTLPQLRLVGARLDHVSNREAALLMYDNRGARVSLMVFPSHRVLRPPPRFEEKLIHGHSVITGRHRGYNVMAWTRGSLVYSVVSDVDEHELVHMVHAF
ncbi:MAG: zf-HC2 domain-containing protein [Myxococcales bacterium]|nr:zf-HC2 domain-containing protein [Myxococcales bacterium]